MLIRPRYFIETKDHLFFAVNSYTHPEDYVIAFLRYVPDDNGDRQLENVRYRKLDSQEAYEYVQRTHPDYLFNYNIANKKSMGVKRSDILKIHDPIRRLKEIIDDQEKDSYYDKVVKLAGIFHDKAGISYDNMGITGSTLINLQDPDNSDIDFIVFGLENHYNARRLYGQLKDDPSSCLSRIEGDFWERLYAKRIKDNSLTLEEFKWYESRKNNRGLIYGTLFDILSTMNPEDIRSSDTQYYRQIGSMKIRCRILDASQSFDTPSIYRVKDVEVIEGTSLNIKDVVSYTHTYAGEVIDNEVAICSGVCEEVTSKESDKTTYQLVVGSTRESINEYIKLEESPVEK